MALNKTYIRRYCLLGFVLVFSLALIYKMECSHYKIGPSGEYGEITILKDYVIFGHYPWLFAPKSNYIRIPIKYESSVLEIEMMADSIIRMGAYPWITSYELSGFKGVDTSISTYSVAQEFRVRKVVMRCIVSAHGYGLYPTFYYCLPDSTIIRQEYGQRFFFESPDRRCYYDTIR